MSKRIEMIKELQSVGYPLQDINQELQLTTPKRDELLSVATAIYAAKSVNDDLYDPDAAVQEAINLIQCVDDNL